MRNYIIIFILLFSTSIFSQNWNVFNKNYRYNYKYNNSALVSNVLFAEQVTVLGMDTVYSMNLIGVVSGNILKPNKPQFLQKNIRKYSNGLVKLYDTTKIMIMPSCSLNETWLFDSVYNLNATCIAISTQNIFSVVDSVKTILINSVDTMKLTKQFGIIQFPKLYGQNKYYRLVGIEHRNKYDSIPFIGERVPNAWDFYNFKLNESYCEAVSSYYIDDQNSANSQYLCKYSELTYINKSFSAGTVSYSVNSNYQTANSFACYSLTVNTFTNYVLALKLDSLDRIENILYPGKVCCSGSYCQVAKFNTDQSGRFYKYFGKPDNCNNAISSLIGNSEPMSYILGSGNNFYEYSNGYYSLCFGTGLGKIYERTTGFMQGTRYCLNCASDVGLKKNNDHQSAALFPNPANTEVNVGIENSTVRIYNAQGMLILDQYLKNRIKVDVSDIPKGLYFVEIQNDSFKTTQKLIIEH